MIYFSNFFFHVFEWDKTYLKHKKFTFYFFQIQNENDIEMLVVTFTIRKIMFVVALFWTEFFSDLEIIQLFFYVS
jgi:hypothetical protein